MPSDVRMLSDAETIIEAARRLADALLAIEELRQQGVEMQAPPGEPVQTLKTACEGWLERRSETRRRSHAI